MDKLKDVLDKGEQIIFTDHQYILQNQPVAGAAGIQEVNVLLGLDHQIVRSILISTPTATVYNNPNTNGNELLGAYFSVGSSVINADTGKGGNTLQLTINSQPVYLNPLDTDAKKDAAKLVKFLMDNGIEAYLLSMKEKDPSELGFEEFWRRVKQTEQSTFSDIIKGKLYG